MFLHNVAEYQALIISLQIAIEMGILQLEIFGDSKLVINQILEQYDVKKEDLVPYCKYAKKLLANFEAITLEHIPRKENRQANALANLATALALSQEETTKVAISQRWAVPLVVEEEEEEQANIISVCLVEKEDWRQVIIEYFNMEDSQMINTTRPKFGEGLLDSFTIRILSSAVHLMDCFSTTWERRRLNKP